MTNARWGLKAPGRAGRAAVVLVLALTWSFGHSSPAAACSCVTLSETEAFAAADVVFAATLLEVRTPDGDVFRLHRPRALRVRGRRGLQGRSACRAVHRHRPRGASCGLELAGDGPFLIFAQHDSGGLTGGAVDGELYAGLCGGSRTLTAVPETFGPGAAPAAGSSPVGSPSDSQTPIASYLGGALAVAVVCGSVGLLISRHRSRPNPAA